MILAYNWAVEERLTKWSDANQQQPLGRDITAAVYEIHRLRAELAGPADLTEPFTPDAKLTLSQAVRLQKALRAQYDAGAQDGRSLQKVLRKLDERSAALAIAIRLMGLHLEMVTPGGVGRDTEAWATAQGRLRVLRELLGELDEIREAARPDPPPEAPYDNLQGTQ